MKAKPYAIEFARKAEKELAALGRQEPRRILVAVSGLAENPRPAGCRKLVGGGEAYRIRVGLYRVSYVIEEGKLVVLIVRAGHRKDVCRSR